MCQKAWYEWHNIKGSTYYNYKSLFLNGDVRVVHGNSGFQKPRPNTIAIIRSINRIMEKKLDKASHLVHLVN